MSTSPSLPIAPVLASLGAFRLLLVASPLPSLLQNNHQLSSPLTAHARLQEGVFLLGRGIDPYAFGLVRHSPLALAAFSSALPLSFAPIIWTAVDIIGAWALISIYNMRSATTTKSSTPPSSPLLSPQALLAAVYLLNPYLALSSLAYSTSTFDNALLLLSVLFACKGKTSLSTLFLALLTHSSLSSVMLLPPLVMLLLNDPSSKLARPNTTRYRAGLTGAIRPVFEFIFYFGILAGVSTFVAGGTGWVKQTWGAVLTLQDLTPNPGLWWYFFTEMFDHYRSFFLVSFSIHLISYVAPISLKFQHDPLYAIFLLTGVLATFKSYATLADAGLFISLLAVFEEVWPYLRHPIPTTFLYIYSTLLQPLFHNLWLNQGTGNANFYYAATLVFGLANGGALIDACWAGLRIAFAGLETGSEPEGKGFVGGGKEKGVNHEVVHI